MKLIVEGNRTNILSHSKCLARTGDRQRRSRAHMVEYIINVSVHVCVVGTYRHIHIHMYMLRQRLCLQGLWRTLDAAILGWTPSHCACHTVAAYSALVHLEH